MRESKIEKALKTEVEKRKGLCIKLVPLFFAGIPDRLVLLPNGIMFFCELKTEGKQPRAIQRIVHERLRALGFNVEVADSVQRCVELVNEYTL